MAPLFDFASANSRNSLQTSTVVQLSAVITQSNVYQSTKRYTVTLGGFVWIEFLQKYIKHPVIKTVQLQMTDECNCQICKASFMFFTVLCL